MQVQCSGKDPTILHTIEVFEHVEKRPDLDNRIGIYRQGVEDCFLGFDVLAEVAPRSIVRSWQILRLSQKIIVEAREYVSRLPSLARALLCFFIVVSGFPGSSRNTGEVLVHLLFRQHVRLCFGFWYDAGFIHDVACYIDWHLGPHGKRDGVARADRCLLQPSTSSTMRA